MNEGLDVIKIVHRELFVIKYIRWQGIYWWAGHGLRTEAIHSILSEREKLGRHEI